MSALGVSSGRFGACQVMTPDHPGGHPYIRNTRSGEERISLFSLSFLTHNPGENHSDAGCVTLHGFVLLSGQQSGDTAFFDKGNSGVANVPGKRKVDMIFETFYIARRIGQATADFFIA
jgi:hypothetical protein